MEVGFGITACVLLVSFFILQIISGILYFKSQNHSYVVRNSLLLSKEHIYKNLCFLSGVRVFQYVFLLLISFEILVLPILDLLLVICTDIGGILFFLLYLSLLIYWGSFLRVIDSGESPTQYLRENTNVVLGRLEVVAFTVCTLDIVVSLTLFFAQNDQALLTTHLWAQSFFTILMVIEGIGFVVISCFVAKSLLSMGRYKILTRKACQILLSGVFILCITIYCVALTLFALRRAFEIMDVIDEATDSDPLEIILEDFVHSLYGYYPMYLGYVFLSELLPFSVFIYVQSKNAFKERPSDYMDLNMGDDDEDSETCPFGNNGHSVVAEYIDINNSWNEKHRSNDKRRSSDMLL